MSEHTCMAWKTLVGAHAFLILIATLSAMARARPAVTVDPRKRSTDRKRRGLLIQADWREYRHGPEHGGHNFSEIVLNGLNVPNLQMRPSTLLDHPVT